MPFHPAMTNGKPWTSSLLQPGRPINPKANIPELLTEIRNLYAVGQGEFVTHRPSRVIATLPPYPPLQIQAGERRYPPNWSMLHGYSQER